MRLLQAPVNMPVYKLVYEPLYKPEGRRTRVPGVRRTRMSAHSNTKHRSGGFTLIEVMLALSIFTLAALAALQVASAHLRSISVIEERTFATMVASNRMAQIHSGDQWPPQNGAAGRMMMAERPWYWRQEVVATVTDGLREVTVIVSVEEDGTEAARLVGFVGQP